MLWAPHGKGRLPQKEPGYLLPSMRQKTTWGPGEKKGHPSSGGSRQSMWYQMAQICWGGVANLGSQKMSPSAHNDKWKWCIIGLGDPVSPSQAQRPQAWVTGRSGLIGTQEQLQVVLQLSFPGTPHHLYPLERQNHMFTPVCIHVSPCLHYIAVGSTLSPITN